MSDGTWVFVPTAGPNSKYVVQAASAEDPLGAVVVADRIIMSGIHADRPAPSGNLAHKILRNSDNILTIP
jgi:hypothetical protein